MIWLSIKHVTSNNCSYFGMMCCTLVLAPRISQLPFSGSGKREANYLSPHLSVPPGTTTGMACKNGAASCPLMHPPTTLTKRFPHPEEPNWKSETSIFSSWSRKKKQRVMISPRAPPPLEWNGRAISVLPPRTGGVRGRRQAEGSAST